MANDSTIRNRMMGGQLRQFLSGLALLLLFIGMIAGNVAVAAEEQEADTKVRPIECDYETLWLKVDGNGNNKVYYTDKINSTWYEAVNPKGGIFYIDLSWINKTSATALFLKGDVCEEAVKVELPGVVTGLKAKFDKKTGTIEMSGVPDGITEFEWRKDTSWEWHTASVSELSALNSDFNKMIEKFRVSGAKIVIRLAPVKGGIKEGTSEFDPGRKASKEVKVTISKRANAPKVKIDGTKLFLSTKDTMEYSLDEGTSWTTATKNMPISEVTTEVFGADAKACDVWIRAKASKSNGHSKFMILTIPAQRNAPTISKETGDDVVWTTDGKKITIVCKNASKTLPYEYTIVKAGSTYDSAKASWKAVVSSKAVSVSERNAPEGSTIYVRLKTTKETAQSQFEIASASASIAVTYATEK